MKYLPYVMSLCIALIVLVVIYGGLYGPHPGIESIAALRKLEMSSDLYFSMEEREALISYIELLGETKSYFMKIGFYSSLLILVVSLYGLFREKNR